MKKKNKKIALLQSLVLIAPPQDDFQASIEWCAKDGEEIVITIIILLFDQKR